MSDRSPFAERAQVEDRTQVSGARAMAVRVARQSGFDVRRVDSLALVATELAENLHRYARQGELIVVPPTTPGSGWLRLISLDRGPGVARFGDCLVDGYSTGGTMGAGLGAVQRIADDFDAVSEAGRGTVISAGFVLPGRPVPTHVEIGAIGFAPAGAPADPRLAELVGCSPAALAGRLPALAGSGKLSIAGVRRDGGITSYGTVEQHTALPAEELLVLHTAGLTAGWTLAGRTELLGHRAEIIAAALWRDHTPDTGDSLVVVVRATPTRGEGR